MATNRYANPGDRLFDSAGNLLSNGKLFFYTPGTTTEKAIYTTSSLSVERDNPVILSGTGLIPPIFLDGEYDVVVQNSSGVQVDTGDTINIGGINGVNLQDWSSTQTYPLDAVVIGSDDNIYISLAANNLNNNPVSTVGTSWDYFLNSGIKRGLTAGTTQTQGGATAMTASINEFSTVANTNDGGKLPSDTGIGERVMVVNNGANDMQVWPASGDSIDDEATDAVDPNKLAAGESRVYTRQTSTKWTSPAQAGAGALETSSATDITFTASSVVNHSITMTAADKSVILPDATTLQDGQEYLIHCAITSNAFTVENDSNAMIATLQPGDVNLIRLIDNATAAGTWIARDLPKPDLVSFSSAFTNSETVSGYSAAARLSDTKAVYVWWNGSAIKGCVVNSDGTAGTAITVYTGVLGYVDICRMTDTTALVVHDNASGNDVAVTHLSVSGNTLTADASDDNTGLSILNEVGVSVAKIATDKAVIAYRYNDTQDGIRFASVSISGTTPTVAASNSTLDFASSTGEADTAHELKLLTSVNSKVICIYEDSSGATDTIAVTDADPPVQSGSTSGLLDDGTYIDAVEMDNSMFIAAGTDASTGDDIHIRVFGVDATDGDYDSSNTKSLTNTAYGENLRWCQILKMSGTRAIVLFALTADLDSGIYYVVTVPDGTASNSVIDGPYTTSLAALEVVFSDEHSGCGPMGDGKALLFDDNQWQIVELTEGLL